MDHLISTSDRMHAPGVVSSDATELLRMGKRLSWKVRPIGRAPIPQEPVFVDGWWLVPVKEDQSAIPRRARNRVATIYAGGLRPKEFIVAHEAPAALQAPHRRRPAPGADFQPTPANPAGTPTAQALRPLVACLAGIAKALLAALAFSGILVAAVVDPVLIAVTEDGYWVEIDRWEV